MIHAYDEIYLDDAMETLGSAVEYAVIFCGMDGQEFLNLFIISGLADEFGSGSVKFISGMSGIEFARLVLETCGKHCGEIHDLPYIDYPPEYWVGWILAYYQWYSGKSFETICKRISYEDIRLTLNQSYLHRDFVGNSYTFYELPYSNDYLHLLIIFSPFHLLRFSVTLSKF